MSKNSPHIQALNQYLDGELDARDMSRVERMLKQNSEMRKHLAELYRTRSLFRQAHQDTRDGTNPKARPTRSGLYTKALAAGLLLTLGVIIGWTLHPTDYYFRSSMAYVPEGTIAIHPVTATTNSENKVRTVFHITSADPKKLKDALDKAEGLLEYYANAGRSVQLEIIANAGGLNLLRADVSPQLARVQAMQKKYKNLSFLACQKTLKRLKQEKGIDARLLPDVIVVPSALDMIIERMEKGWSYIQA
jgi:uncharacterized protein